MKSRSDAAILAFFAFVAILYFGLLEKNGSILCGPDQFFIDHPVQSSWLSHLFNRNVPWILNSVAGGIPLWADPNLGIFYPGNLIYLVLPTNDAWNLSLIFHLFWGQFGIYWLCRKFQLPVVAALTGAVAFLFSSPALSTLNSNEVLITASWVPWILGLTYFGIQQSCRKTVLAAMTLAFQWLGGFVFVQAFTLILVIMIFARVYFSARQNIILVRSLLLLLCTVLMIAIQWVPAILWLQNSNTEFFRIEFAPKQLPYLGWLAAALFLIGLKNRIVWFAVPLILVDYFLFKASPILAICFAMGVAAGTAQILRKYDRPLTRILPVLVAIELMLVNWQVPQSLPLSQITRVPPIVREISDFRQWNIHYSGTRGALSPLAGLNWGLAYGTPPESGLMLWRFLPERKETIEYCLRNGKSLQLLRDARIGYVVSDVLFHNPELGLVRQNSTKFYVHRLRIPVSAVIISSNREAIIRWFDIDPDSMVIETNAAQPVELIIHRNALPGWQCKWKDKELPIGTDTAGWMKITAPPGKNRLHLTYRAPGAVAGTIITLIGTILILAFLLL